MTLSESVELSKYHHTTSRQVYDALLLGKLQIGYYKITLHMKKGYIRFFIIRRIQVQFPMNIQLYCLVFVFALNLYQ
jgi:hypothetical protein